MIFFFNFWVVEPFSDWIMGGLAPDLQQMSMWCLKKSKRLREGLKKGGWVGLPPDQFFVNFSRLFFFKKT